MNLSMRVERLRRHRRLRDAPCVAPEGFGALCAAQDRLRRFYEADPEALELSSDVTAGACDAGARAGMGGDRLGEAIDLAVRADPLLAGALAELDRRLGAFEDGGEA